MLRYDFAMLHKGGDRISIYCTSNAVLDSLKDELFKIDTTSKLEIRSLKFSGEESAIEVHVKNEIDQIRWWIIKWFCVSGWEPSGMSEGYYSFRRPNEESTTA